MEIGSRLKEAREAKNLSLEEVQGITKIQTRYLDAIDKGNFEIMPGAFYVRAFIKEYAGAVGLDPNELMEEHADELPKPTEDNTIQYSRVQRSRSTTTGSSSKGTNFLSFIPTLIIILVVIGIGIAIWSFLQSSSDEPENSGNSNQNEAVEEEVVVTEEPQENTDENTSEDASQGNEEEGNRETASDEEENTDGESNQEPSLELTNQGSQGNEETVTYSFNNPGEEVLLEIDTDSEHWLEVTSGSGENLYSAMFNEANAPLEEDLTGEESFTMRFGNPADLNVTLNGVSLELPEETNKSQVHQVTIEVGNNEESN